MQAESLPQNKKVDLGAVNYELSAKNESNGIRIVRSRRMRANLFTVAEYPSIRNYFNQVVAGDTQQVLLHKTNASAAK